MFASVADVLSAKHNSAVWQSFGMDLAPGAPTVVYKSTHNPQRASSTPRYIYLQGDMHERDDIEIASQTNDQRPVSLISKYRSGGNVIAENAAANSNPKSAPNSPTFFAITPT